MGVRGYMGVIGGTQGLHWWGVHGDGVPPKGEPNRAPVQSPYLGTWCPLLMKSWLGETRPPKSMWKPLQTDSLWICFVWPNQCFHIF